MGTNNRVIKTHDKHESKYNEIELSNDLNSKDRVVGKSAQICEEAWAYSTGGHDLKEALKLFKYDPYSRYMIFTEDGVHRATIRKLALAKQSLKEREVLVYWGGG